MLLVRWSAENGIDRMLARQGWREFFVAGVLAATLLPRLAHAQQTRYDGVDPYEEYGKRVKSAQQIAPPADSAFGEHVSLYNGATTFQAADVSIPGSIALSATPAREKVARDLRLQPPGGDGPGGFGDGDLGVPHIDGTLTRQSRRTHACTCPRGSGEAERVPATAGSVGP